MRKLLLMGTVASLASGSSAVSTVSDEFFEPLGVPVDQSVSVVRLSDGKSLFQVANDHALIPASVTKLVTSAAVLATFGPNHHFTTRFFLDGRRLGDVLHGNLIIVGDGDPFIVNEKLWQMAADFRHLGVREITGDIVIDNSLFVGPSRDRSRQDGAAQSTHAYDAPVSAFGVNFNTFALAMSPGLRVGAAATVGIDPYKIFGIAIESSLSTIAPQQSPAIQVLRVSEGRDAPKLVIRGGIPLDQGIQRIYRSVDDHVSASGETVRSFLLREGIRVKGRVREGRKSDSAATIYELQGFNVGYVIAGLNTFSNNYIADVLVQRLGARQGRSDLGSMEGGIQVISTFLREQVGIKDPFVLANGSGLDASNRLSAAQLTRLLVYMESRFDLFPEFIASLPASGEDGTMEKRFKSGRNQHLKGLIRAKTGTLTQPLTVATLAGYFRHPRHGLVAFAIIENGTKGRPQPQLSDLRSRQDKAIDKMWQNL